MIIDAGSDGSDPKSAVPFSLTTKAGKEFKQPGNFFRADRDVGLRHRAEVHGQGRRGRPRRQRQGRVPRGAPGRRLPARRGDHFVKYAKELDDKAKEWQPTLEDAYTAVVVMTPTMSEYFEAWKNWRCIAGSKAEEKGFVATSRLQDIRDILGGIVLIYDSIQPSVQKVNADQAAQPRPTSTSCISSPAGC